MKLISLAYRLFIGIYLAVAMFPGVILSSWMAATLPTQPDIGRFVTSLIIIVAPYISLSLFLAGILVILMHRAVDPPPLLSRYRGTISFMGIASAIGTLVGIAILSFYTYRSWIGREVVNTLTGTQQWIGSWISGCSSGLGLLASVHLILLSRIRQQSSPEI